MTPLVSILIPAYNSERWIADTIRSALAQSWPRKEIIVVNDGSRDQTLAVANQFAGKDVAVLSHANQGASATRNKAWSACQGDYVQWLDADDLISPNKIAMQMAALDDRCSNRTLLSSAWGQFLCRPAKASFVPTDLWCDLSPVDWLLRKIEQDLFMQPATWLVSRELTSLIGPWDTRLSLDDDGEYFCRAVKMSDGIRFVPGVKTFYRKSPGSLSSTDASDKKRESQWLSSRLQFEHLRALDDGKRGRSACLKNLQVLLPYFYPERADLVTQAEQYAADLGGRLERPRLPWKYAWIQRAFGWRVAKRVQFGYNQWKAGFQCGWDRMLQRCERWHRPDYTLAEQTGIERK